MHWSESALEEAQDYAHAFRDGTKLQGLPELPRLSKEETSLDGVIFNKLAGGWLQDCNGKSVDRLPVLAAAGDRASRCLRLVRPHLRAPAE